MIVGVTNIRHSVRHKLKISLTEYTVLDYLQNCAEDGIPPSESSCERQLGEHYEALKPVIDDLVLKGLVEWHREIPAPTNKWTTKFGFKQDQFLVYNDGVYFGERFLDWRSGSSKDAVKRKLKAALKEVELEVLIFKKLQYFVTKYLSGSFEYIMNPERFVGPDKYYNSTYHLNEKGKGILLNLIRSSYTRETNQWGVDLSGFIPELEKSLGITPRNSSLPEENGPKENKDYFND